MKHYRFTVFAAIVLILAGVCMALDSLGLFGVNFVWWPLIIVALALYLIITSGLTWGKGFLLLIGLWFLLERNTIMPDKMRSLLPAWVIIYCGFYLLWRAIMPAPSHNVSTGSSPDDGVFSSIQSINDDDFVRVSLTFADSNIKCVSPNLMGGDVSTTFAKLFLDLTEAKINPSGAVIDVSVTFAQCVVVAPKDASVRVIGTPFLGSINNHAHFNAPESVQLTVRASVAFGELRINQ